MTSFVNNPLFAESATLPNKKVSIKYNVMLEWTQIGFFRFLLLGQSIVFSPRIYTYHVRSLH